MRYRESHLSQETGSSVVEWVLFPIPLEQGLLLMVQVWREERAEEGRKGRTTQVDSKTVYRMNRNKDPTMFYFGNKIRRLSCKTEIMKALSS